MADLKYQVQVETQQGIQSLQRLQNEVNKVSGAFDKLKGAIAGLGIGALTLNAIQYAAAIDDIASASGMAIANVLGFSKSVAIAGGNAEAAQTGIARLANFIDDAATGNRKAQESFAALGISLNDIAQLSEQDLLRKTIQGLANMEDNAKRTALGMSIFGKSFATVDLKTLNDQIDQNIQRSRQYESAIKSAADAEEKFGIAVDAFKTSLLAALEPITKFFASLDAKTIQDTVDTLVELGKVVATIGAVFAVFKFIIDPIRNLRGEVAALAVEGWTLKETFGVLKDRISQTASGPIKGLKNDLGLIIDAFKNTKESGMQGATGLERLGVAFGGLLAVGSRLLGWLSVAYAAFEALDFIIRKVSGSGIKDWAERAAKALGLISQTSKEIAAANQAEQDKLKRLAETREQERKALEKKREVQAWFEEALGKERQKIAENVANYQLQNAEQLKKFELQTRLMRQSEEYKLVEEERAAAEEAYLKAIQPLLAQRQSILDKGAKANELELATVKELDKAIQNISKQFQDQEPLRQQAVNDRIKEMQITKELAYWSEILTKQEETRRAVSEGIGDYMRDGLSRVREGAQALENLKLTPLQRQLEDIRREEERIAKAAKDRIAEQYTGPEGDISDTAGFARALQTVEATQRRITEERQRQAEQVYEQQRSFSQGWKEAFQEYSENATNAAQNAKGFFQRATKGMEDAIVNFAKTGKFEWRGFVASLAEELLRSQVSKLIAQLFGSIGGGGGGNIFSSIASFFAGFFATGGTIPAGKFGVVGERGPEFVTGPASVTPMGGTTVVNYNINAVDAMSFKQMLARDPAFIHSVAERGRNSIPSRR